VFLGLWRGEGRRYRWCHGRRRPARVVERHRDGGGGGPSAVTCGTRGKCRPGASSSGPWAWRARAGPSALGIT